MEKDKKKEQRSNETNALRTSTERRAATVYNTSRLINNLIGEKELLTRRINYYLINNTKRLRECVREGVCERRVKK